MSELSFLNGKSNLHFATFQLKGATLSPDGTELAIPVAGLKYIDMATGRVIRELTHSNVGQVLAWSGDGRTIAQASGNVLVLTDAATGNTLRTLSGHQSTVRVAAFSPDSKIIATGDWGSRSNDIILWDAATGVQRLRLVGAHSSVTSLAFSDDGSMLLSSGWDNSVKLWSVSSGVSIRHLEIRPGWINRDIDQLGWVDAAIFLAKDSQIAASARDGSIKILDTRSGKVIHGWEGHPGGTYALAVSPGGNVLASGGNDGSVRLWDIKSGVLKKTLLGHFASVWKVFFSPEGNKVYSTGDDNALRIWSSNDGQALGAMFGNGKGEILTITPAGFFNATSTKWQELNAVKGYDVFSIDQMYQSLYSPDLVRESLAGDPDGEVKKAAESLDLEMVLDSGKAPEVVIASPQADAALKDEVITAEAHVADQGGGIGRIEWRVNGVTAGVVNAAPGSGNERTVTQTLALEPGDNAIEVVAYNGRNLLASLPVSTKVKWDAPADQPKPKLHVIAVGINDYNDPTFPKLSHGVDDAKAFGAAMQAGGEGLYGKDNVEVTYVLDKEATAERLDHIIDAVGAKTHPRDTFIFLAAAHGKSENGRFHMIPQDYRSDAPGTLAEKTIGQDRLQDWFANRIKARRGLILLDTCESGALVASRPSGVDAGNSEAALGRLNEATGRPVLTAAAADKAALEGYKGHGIFTYALLDALINGDTNGDGKIEVSELANHIQTLAPKLSQELQNGKPAPQKSRGAITLGSAAIVSRMADYRQKPKLGSRGEDFPLVNRLTSLSLAQ
jgi:WD40 repeat protein